MNQKNLFVPKKSLGQNFLVNPNIAERIVNSCHFKPTDTALEIGPGKGALTRNLSAQCKNVLAIEKDPKLFEQLKKEFEHTNVSVIHADFLKYSLPQHPKNIKIIGNLPYNIATPIIKKLIDHHKNFSEIFITVQLEFGQRVIAKPNSKNYGSLSCYVQYYMDVELLFKINNTAFRPVPKVQSCFLRLIPLKQPKHKTINEDLLFKIIHSCFGQRRKTIANSLASALGKERGVNTLKSLNINPKLRAENLSLEDYIQITNTVE